MTALWGHFQLAENPPLKIEAKSGSRSSLWSRNVSALRVLAMEQPGVRERCPLSKSEKSIVSSTYFALHFVAVYTTMRAFRVRKDVLPTKNLSHVHHL